MARKKNKLIPGQTYKVKFLRDFFGCYDLVYKKDEVANIKNWHGNKAPSRSDWHSQIVICHGWATFDTLQPGVDIEIIKEETNE